MAGVGDGDEELEWSETSAETSSEVDERPVNFRDGVSAALYFRLDPPAGRNPRSVPPLSVGPSPASRDSTIALAPAPASSSPGPSVEVEMGGEMGLAAAAGPLASPLPPSLFTHDSYGRPWMVAEGEDATMADDTGGFIPATVSDSLREEERMKVLHMLNVLDTEPDPVLEALTKQAAEALEADMALISIVDDHRQWFRAAHALDVPETPRSFAFCAWTIEQPLNADQQTFIVPDTHRDRRFATNPLVVGAPHIRAYVGAPLTTRDGVKIGTLCTLSRTPGAPDRGQVEKLVELAAAVTKDIERNAGRTMSLANTIPQPQQGPALMDLRHSGDTAPRWISNSSSTPGSAAGELDLVPLLPRLGSLRYLPPDLRLQKFLQQLSHAFRTPLNSLTGSAQILLQDQQMKPESRDEVHQILRGAGIVDSLLSQLIDDLEEQRTMVAGDGEIVAGDENNRSDSRPATPSAGDEQRGGFAAESGGSASPGVRRAWNQAAALKGDRQRQNDALQDMCVLAVDDNHMNKRIMVRFLELAGISRDNILTASNGKEGLEGFLSAGRHVDCIFMDLQMPVMGGSAATRLIREHEDRAQDQLGRTYVVATTADQTRFVKDRCSKAGFNEVLFKPLTIEATADVLQRAQLYRKERRRN